MTKTYDEIKKDAQVFERSRGMEYHALPEGEQLSLTQVALGFSIAKLLEQYAVNEDPSTQTFLLNCIAEYWAEQQGIAIHPKNIEEITDLAIKSHMSVQEVVDSYILTHMP